MTHPLADMPDRPPGRGPSGTAATGEPSLSMQQRTVLERLITRLVALTSQQNAEVWACVKHDLGLKGDSPLLACHFSAAEASLNQRLAAAQDNHHHRQTLAQLSDLLGQGNNRQAVSDYIRQHYGQTALHALSQTQLETILHLLQHGQLSIPQPQQRPPTLRPLLPAEHNTLNQLVTEAGGRYRRTKQADLAIHAGALRRQVRGADPGDALPAAFVLAAGAANAECAKRADAHLAAGSAQAAAGGRGVADNCRLRQSQLAGHAADHAEPGADPGAAEQGVCAAGGPRPGDAGHPAGGACRQADVER